MTIFLRLFIFVEYQTCSERRKLSIFLKTFSGGGKWSLTDIADHTQLGSPARQATKRRMIQYFSSQCNMYATVRRLEQQLQESQVERNQLQKDFQSQADDSNSRTVALQKQLEI